MPLPVLLIVPLLAIGAEMTRWVGAPTVVEVLMFAPSGRVSSVPAIVGTVAALSFTAVIAFVADNVRPVAPVFTVGFVMPPVLLKVRLLSVLSPAIVNTPLPLMVTSFVDAICPPDAVVKVAPLIVRPPAGINPVVTATVPAPLTAVPPV